MVSILDQRFQDAEQRFLEVMYGTKKVTSQQICSYLFVFRVKVRIFHSASRTDAIHSWKKQTITAFKVCSSMKLL